MKDIMVLSQQTYNLSLAESLLVRQLGKQLGYEVCSQLGGCESIRDIRQSKILGVEALECDFIESRYSVDKLKKTVLQVYRSKETSQDIKRIFINISTVRGFELIESGVYDELGRDLCVELVPMIDRRSIAREKYGLTSNSFELEDMEEEVNSFIARKIAGAAIYGISGGIRKASGAIMRRCDLSPTYLKTGFFIFRIKDWSKVEVKISELHAREALVLETLSYYGAKKFAPITDRRHRIVHEILKEGE